MLRGLNQQTKLGGPLCRSSVEFLCVGSPASPRPRSAFSGQRDHPECSSECLQPQLGAQTSMIGMRASGGFKGIRRTPRSVALDVWVLWVYVLLANPHHSNGRGLMRVEIFCWSGMMAPTHKFWVWLNQNYIVMVFFAAHMVCKWWSWSWSVMHQVMPFLMGKMAIQGCCKLFGWFGVSRSQHCSSYVSLFSSQQKHWVHIYLYYLIFGIRTIQRKLLADVWTWQMADSSSL